MTCIAKQQGLDANTGVGRRLVMPVPDCQSFMLPLLKIAGDGNEHSNPEVYETLAQQFGLNEADRTELIPSKRDRTFDNRVRWACTHLRKAHLLSSTVNSKFCITERGMKVLKENPAHIDYEFLRQFPDYLAWLRSKNRKKE